MSMHPWTMHEIARARDEEMLLRGLAAYQALRVQPEHADEQGAVTGSAGRSRFLDRLLRRDVEAAHVPARPAV